MPEKVYEYTLDLWATSHVFKAGHRLRLEVSSSNFPRYDRNPNTGHEFGVDAELRTAQQTIFHDNRYPSHFILPMIPR
jgi:putative CocE/NonD family hydrolase